MFIKPMVIPRKGGAHKATVNQVRKEWGTRMEMEEAGEREKKWKRKKLQVNIKFKNKHELFLMWLEGKVHIPFYFF